jgi:hypothetical protein
MSHKGQGLLESPEISNTRNEVEDTILNDLFGVVAKDLRSVTELRVHEALSDHLIEIVDIDLSEDPHHVTTPKFFTHWSFVWRCS